MLEPQAQKEQRHVPEDIPESVSPKNAPASEPLHMSVRKLFSN